ANERQLGDILRETNKVVYVWLSHRDLRVKRPQPSIQPNISSQHFVGARLFYAAARVSYCNSLERQDSAEHLLPPWATARGPHLQDSEYLAFSLNQARYMIAQDS